MERFFNLRRLASRDNFIDFTNLIDLVFYSSRAVYQLNAYDGRR
jgi:hypothetical protein